MLLSPDIFVQHTYVSSRPWMLVSTQGKWDFISRKGSGDASLVTLVKLLIIDEIHLLCEDRGAVIEVVVARTLRQVETSQTLIRLVGLSATLPNYEDVAHFLHVYPYRGLFYFDDQFRPVPLRMSFYGVRGSNCRVQKANMNAACYELFLKRVKRGEQSNSALSEYLGRVVRSSALDLDATEMIRCEPQTRQLASTNCGRTASLFYIRFSTAAMVRDTLELTTMLPQIFCVLNEASDFVVMNVRDEEGGELNNLKGSFCRVPIRRAGNVDSDVPANVNALLQGYISRHLPVCHSLASDMNFIRQNAGRLVRYLFEILLRQ
ncbi:hypothetical protein P879_11413 [Paragonimus westermani]|uniref:Helicase ATP-binding domain-containing protein n=1 Tax=Paragonimus westermani TaxID=34504 RepID=A0A8T0D9F3_9TREM|nr:hypothetical protein P879_11413 [Paragonimus westermani]